MEVHQCVSFIMLNGEEVLLEKRSEYKKTDPGLITIPGGHIEGGETPTEAMKREMNEELNVTPIDFQYLCSLYHPTSEMQLIHYFVISHWQGDIIAQEAEQVMWYPMNSAQVGIDADRIALAEVTRIGGYL
tara:strand:- start:297 stop:689 length:393 start_codon:yes stop_codon:yes gene_type:complete